METIAFQNGKVTLNAVAAGAKNGPVVLLLHGFPEFWYGWHKQIEPLAAAGFRVIVPDQRGYNKSSKPSGVRCYALTELVSDVIAIADQLGQKRIFLAGHDWGAAVAWSVALLHPNRVAKLAIPSNFRRGVASLAGSSRPGTFSADDLALYRAAWSQPGALTAMIHWYRAAFRYRAKFSDRTVHVPTRILWGLRDRFLMAEMARDSLHYCTQAELITFPEATHWLQHEEPARVSQILVDFFSA